MTLAQSYIDHGSLAPHWERSAEPRVLEAMKKCHTFLVASLQLPLSVETAEFCAERFVFDEDPSQVVGRLSSENKDVTFELFTQMIVLPASTTWLEFPVYFVDAKIKGKVGMLFFRDPEHDTCSIIIAIEVPGIHSGLPIPIGLCVLDPTPPWKQGTQVHYEIRWAFGRRGNALEEGAQKEITTYIWGALDALFLLAIPKSSDVRTSSWGPRKQRRRLDEGKLPLVELRHVTMRIGRQPARYPHASGTVDRQASEDATHRRLHRVMEHLRVYPSAEGVRERPHITVVPEHWRGDASLGVILHERKVEQESR